MQLAPVTLGQQRVWQVCQQHGHLPLYNMGFSLHLVGEFDVELMNQALDIIIERHAALRTCFKVQQGLLQQNIKPTLKLHHHIIHREYVPIENAQTEIANIAKTEMQYVFDLQNEPLIRNTLVKFANNHIGWIVVMHHSVTDGWSAGVFIYEMNIIYRALSLNQKPVLLPISYSFIDYVKYELDKIDNEKYQNAFAYWQHELTNLPKIHPENQNLDINYAYTTIDKSVMDAISVASKQHDTTVYNLLVAALSNALAKVFQQAEITLLLPVAGRTNLKVQQSIGYFVNLVPLRLNMSNNCIQNVKEKISNAFAYSDVAFEYLQSKLKLEKSHFLCLFSYQNYPKPTNIYNYEILDIQNYNDATEFNINFRIINYQDKSMIEVIYSGYSATTIEQLIKVFMLEINDSIF